MESNRAGHAQRQAPKRRLETAGVAGAKSGPVSPATPDPGEQIRLTDVAHLLSQPLTVLRGSLELALLTAQEPGELRAAAEEALEQAEEMVRLEVIWLC